MGKRGRSINSPIGNHSVTLREEKTGKKDQSSNQKSKNNGVIIKFNDRLKIEHLERISSWAAGEAKIPSLAAFYGRKLAGVRESLGVPPNPSLFQCHRCETVLIPGTNCTVSARKNKLKSQKVVDEKLRDRVRNLLLYSCHFCSHKNPKRDTSKQQRNSKETETETCPVEFEVSSAKPIELSNQQRSSKETETHPVEIGASFVKPIELLNTESPNTPMVVREAKDSTKIEDDLNLALAEPSPQKDDLVEPQTSTKLGESLVTDGAATPGPTLLDAKKRKRKKPTAKKTVNNSVSADFEQPSNGKSSKRKKKSWTSLKEIADSTEQAKKRNVHGFPIPFSLESASRSGH